MQPPAAQPFDLALCFVVSLRMDVVDLRNFYAHPLGTVARRFVGRGVRRLWAGSAGLRVLGVGYATPYLGLFREDAERCLAFMPAAQGVVKWPSARPTLVALVDECEQPLPDAAIDRILLVHALELSNDVAALLREVWRVLAAGGRILAVVPNRRGLWARMDTTPFGQGRPYSRSQLTHLLRETWFTPTAWGEALYVPPIDRRWFLRSALAWERTGATMSAPFAGVHLVEATKQVYRAIPVREKKLVPTLKPVLKPVLAPSPGGAARISSLHGKDAQGSAAVARMERSVIRDWAIIPEGSAPDYAALHPGYGRS